MSISDVLCFVRDAPTVFIFSLKMNLPIFVRIKTFHQSVNDFKEPKVVFLRFLQLSDKQPKKHFLLNVM